MSSYKYETYATNLYDNFSDNSLTKNWENWENFWKEETGEGVVSENSYIDFVNIEDTSDVKKKKCLVIRANGDEYDLNTPKGLKKGKSQRVGGGVKSKNLMGPGEYNLRVQFTSEDSVCNAIWLFNYLEIEEDDIRHIKNDKYCVGNDIDKSNIVNPEIDFELLEDNKCRCNIFKSTEGLFEENTINLNDLKLKLNNKKWHNLKYIWETSLVKVSDLIGRDLNDEELIITNENFFINGLKDKTYSKLNGLSVIKSIENDNKYCLFYGKRIEISIDNKVLFKKELKELNFKNFINNTIPHTLCYFYIALWFPQFIQKKPDFHHTMMYVDDFSYKSNGNPVYRIFNNPE